MSQNCSNEDNTEVHYRYKLQSNIFILELEYLCNQLTLKLVDMISAKNYERKLTQNDLSKKVIHPQEDLLEIFCNIVSREHLQQMNNGATYLETDYIDGTYTLGTFIDRGGRGFAVFHDGAIETRRTGPPKSLAHLKPDVFISKIVLEEQCEIDHASLLDIKLSEIKREFFKEIKSMKKEISLLKYGANGAKLGTPCDADEQMIASEGSDLYTVALNKKQAVEKQLKLFKEANPLQLDFRSPFVSKFAFDGKKITYKGQNNTWTQILRIVPLPHHQVSSFKVRVEKTATNHLMVGIVDKKTQFNSRYSYNSSNAYAYYGANGYRYPNGGSQGPGLKTFDFVEVIVNPTAGTIQWKINVDQFITTYTVGKENLTDTNREYVPYVEMYTPDDCIKFIDDE